MADYFILFDFILLIIVWYYFGVWRQINDYLFIYLFSITFSPLHFMLYRGKSFGTVQSAINRVSAPGNFLAAEKGKRIF